MLCCVTSWCVVLCCVVLCRAADIALADVTLLHDHRKKICNRRTTIASLPTLDHTKNTHKGVIKFPKTAPKLWVVNFYKRATNLLQLS